MRHREMRLPCDTTVTVRAGGEDRRASFVNISATGARLEGLGRLPRESSVTILHLGARVPARVVWSTDRQCGLRFLCPLTPAEMNALRGVGGRTLDWQRPLTHGFRELT